MEITTKQSKYLAIKELGLLVNAELATEYNTLKNKQHIDEGEIIRSLEADIDDDAIKAKLCSLRGIALGITEACNFRCGYCSYSGIYKHERTHSTKAMSEETALKTVNFFLDLITDNRNLRTRKRNDFSIGFYGGEPLLEFPLVQRVIRETKKRLLEKGPDVNLRVKFRLGTNGYLLKGDVLNYLIDNDVMLDISLDGPETEHNKFRKNAADENTWDTIMENIQNLARKFPDYYESKVSYLCTVHPAHDEPLIESFFTGNPLFQGDNEVSYNPVNISELKPIQRAEIDDILKKRGTVRGGTLLSYYASRTLNEKFKLKELDKRTVFTGTCFPGEEKLLVDVEGKFHICEKMSPHFPIGDVDNGYDLDKIRSLWKAYNYEVIALKCWECDIWFLCNMCFAKATDGKKIGIQCNMLKKSLDTILKSYLEKLEAEKESIDSRELGLDAGVHLKPHVHFVKGTGHNSFYDVLTGNFYRVYAEDEPHQLKQNLEDAGLLFKSDGIVPFKTEFDISALANRLQLRELQIRLSGRKENNCRERLVCDEDSPVMEPAVLDKLKEQLAYIPVVKLRIEADSADAVIIEKILREFPFDSFELHIKEAIDDGIVEAFQTICKERSSAFEMVVNKTKDIEELIIQPFHFFYSRVYNPCLGHKVAVDTDGAVKPCLWADEVLGNVGDDNIKAMIVAGKFDKYWDLTKDKVDVCMNCDLRYACNDCPITERRETCQATKNFST
ncbi:MAG: radical SAM protein [bacterium]|nr:radical SAM protein [bacterium]